MQNKIVKTIVLNASIEQVWKALTDYREFGTWFKVELENPFQEEQISKGVLSHPGCEGMIFSALTVRLDPPTHFSFRWPHDEAFDLTRSDMMENTTLVEFYLEDLTDSTRLTVTESGFESLPEELRFEIIKGNTGGWSIQLKNIRAHVES